MLINKSKDSLCPVKIILGYRKRAKYFSSDSPGLHCDFIQM